MNQEAKQVQGGYAAHVGIRPLVSLVLDLLPLLVAHLLGFRRKLTMGRSRVPRESPQQMLEMCFSFSLEEKFFQTCDSDNPMKHL